MRRTVAVLFGLDIVLFLTFGPTAVAYFYQYLESSELLAGSPYRRIVTYCGYANAAINPIVYIILLPKLRAALAQMLCGAASAERKRAEFGTAPPVSGRSGAGALKQAAVAQVEPVAVIQVGNGGEATANA